MIVLDLAQVQKIDLTTLLDRVMPKYRATFQNRGSHYKLCAYLSDLFEDKVIVEVGTMYGASALAFAANRKNKIITMDCTDRRKAEQFSNWEGFSIEFQCCDINKAERHTDILNRLKSASVIFLDITHNGRDESRFYQLLNRIGYNGLLLLDDIHLQTYGDMESFWASIDKPKFDLTKVGHTSGSGLVDFSDQLQVIESSI